MLAGSYHASRFLQYRTVNSVVCFSGSPPTKQARVMSLAIKVHFGMCVSLNVVYIHDIRKNEEMFFINCVNLFEVCLVAPSPHVGGPTV